jgi:uncharacterized membrane protein
MLRARPGRTVAEVIGMFCCAVFFGAAAYISLVQHPAALETGSDFAVRFFAPMYRRAAIMQASLAIGGAFATMVAYFLGAGRSWLVVAVLISSVIPFTLLIVAPLNEQLKALDPSAERAVELLMQWSRLHWIRTVMSGVAFAICLVAMAGDQTRVRGTRRYI